MSDERFKPLLRELKALKRDHEATGEHIEDLEERINAASEKPEPKPEPTGGDPSLP